MSNEKPKPIIIKSNKGEDTLPLPITKETDWDDTNQLTNQEIKDIYQQTKKEIKLKNQRKENDTQEWSINKIILFIIIFAFDLVAFLFFYAITSLI